MDNSAHINTIYTRHAHGMGPERVVSKAFRRIQLRGLFLGYIYIWHSCHFGVIRENELIVLTHETLNYIELRSILTDIDPQIIVSQQLATIFEARNYLLSHNDCNLIFADIRLGDGLVFDALADVVGNISVVFTTAYDEYAIRAFDYNGIAYLLKPIQKEDVERALLKFRRCSTPHDSFTQLLRSMQQGADIYRQRFLVSHADYSEVIGIESISHIKTENDITRLYLTDGHSVAVGHTLDELSSQLDPSLFFRANRQYIVHIKYVRLIKKWFKGKTILQMNCYPDLCIEVSKERTCKLKQWLDR